MIDWIKYDNLCDELDKGDMKPVSQDLQDAKLYINGLTDGWFGFLNAFENVVKKSVLTEDQKNQANELIKELRRNLKR
jgi:hypothetical protein